MAQISRGGYSIVITDDSRNDQSFSVYTPVVTLGNIVNMNTLATAFKAAVDTLSVGRINQFGQVTYHNTEDPYLAGDAGAENEVNWIVQYKDTVTGRKFTFRIPSPDSNTLALRLPDSDYADTAHAAWVAFKTALEAFAISEDGNAVQFVTAVKVGRNYRKGNLFP
jgi:hypothetical protein